MFLYGFAHSLSCFKSHGVYVHVVYSLPLCFNTLAILQCIFSAFAICTVHCVLCSDWQCISILCNTGINIGRLISNFSVFQNCWNCYSDSDF